jgi:magnesium transporter
MDENADARLKEILEKNDQAAFRELYDSMEPIDFAQLIEDYEPEELTKLTAMLEDDQLASLMEESEDDQRIRIARTLDNKRLLIAFGYMQKDDIVDMLGDFPIGRRKDVINLMKSGDRQIITDLLKYPEESAGGIMTTAYVALRDTLKVSEGLDKIRQIGPRTEVIETLYVVNESRQLIGSVDLKILLSTPRDHTIGSIMDDHVISVEPETDQEQVALLVSRYDLNAIPVVSKKQQILGIITVDDVIDVIVQEYDEDMLQMAGVSSEESLDTTLPQSVRMRLPWLLINLATAFLASFTVKMFETTIAKVVALSAIMTIVSGMGGNAGTQTVSILVRRLAQGELSWEDCKKPFLKEVLLGLVDGAACGLVTALIVWPTYHNFYLGLIVFLAMIGNLLVSSVFGFLIPVIMRKLNWDPAIASTIFLTTATDVLGFFIFLGLATLFMPYLLK